MKTSNTPAPAHEAVSSPSEGLLVTHTIHHASTVNP